MINQGRCKYEHVLILQVRMNTMEVCIHFSNRGRSIEFSAGGIFRGENVIKGGRFPRGFNFQRNFTLVNFPNFFIYLNFRFVFFSLPTQFYT